MERIRADSVFDELMYCPVDFPQFCGLVTFSHVELLVKRLLSTATHLLLTTMPAPNNKMDTSASTLPLTNSLMVYLVTWIGDAEYSKYAAG